MKHLPFALVASASLFGVSSIPSIAQDAVARDPRVIYAPQPPVPIRVAYQDRSGMGGGLIEFLFNGPQSQEPRYERQPQPQPGSEQQQRYRSVLPPVETQEATTSREESIEPGRPGIDPKFEKQVVAYDGSHAPGTLVIDTPNKFLYLVQANGKALRYGIGVGKPGFTWSGVKQISMKKEWPDWTPPAEMLKRRPDLPRHMEGGPENPLGARAMYLGTSLYRIHGSNEPWTIGTNVSSGCIRMRNQDVIDLYGRVPVGTKVVVI